MSSSSKKRKNKWKSVAVEEILPNAIVRPTTSWAEEVESELNEYTIKKISSISLPTAPRATCDVVIDENKIPPNGPFMAYLSNLPYEITEDDIAQQFKELKVVNIQLPKDSRHDRMRGFGYVEFKDKSTLLTALNEGELTLKGRLVRISLPNDEDQNKDKGPRGGGVSFSRRDMSDRIDTGEKNLGEWRAAAPIPRDSDKGGFTRSGPREGGSGGGPFREPKAFDPEPSSFSRGGGFRERDRDRNHDFEGRSNDRDFGGRSNDRDFGGRSNDRDFEGRSNDRGGSRLFGKRYDRDDRDRGGGSRMGFGRRFEQREDREMRREPVPEREEPKSRPKLDIQPRTKPLEPNVPEALPSSIFGGAKPVDTLRREMEIEAKLISKAASQPVARSGTSTPPQRSITPVSYRSRSSSVSSTSSCRKQDADGGETNVETHQEPVESENESNNASCQKPSTGAPSETTEQPPARTKNVWEARKAAAIVETPVSDTPSSVIEKSNVRENSVDVNVVENRSRNEDASSKRSSKFDDDDDNEERRQPSAGYKSTNERNVARRASAAEKTSNSDDDFVRYEPDHFSHPDTPHYQSQSSSRGGGGGGSRYNDNSKFNFNRNNNNNRRDNRRDNRRSDSNGQYKREDNHYGGPRNENSAFGQKWPTNRNRNNGPGGPRRYPERDNNGYSSRDKYENGSNFSNRSSCSSSTTNLRDDVETRSDYRCDRKPDERLIENAPDANAAPVRDDRETGDDRVNIVVSDDNANKKTVENGNENGVEGDDVTRKSDDNSAAIESAELNDNAFSSGKSRKRDKKKKNQDRKDNDQVNERDYKQKNQKDEKKKDGDNHPANEKVNNKNNVKNKEKSTKKNRELRRDTDDISQMPKAKEEKAPAYEDLNKFCLLGNDE